MTQVCGATLRLTVAVLAGVLLSACEAPMSPSEQASSEQEGPEVELGTQEAALEATSSYLDLRLRTGAASAQGNTCGAAREVSSTCGNSNNAPDYNFKWMAPHSGNFSFTTESSTFDTVLQLSQWGNGVSLGCNDNSAGTAQSAMTLYLPAGATIRITVDGANGGCGEFQLNITPQQANCGTSFCNSPPSACTETFGTCTSTGCSYAPRPAGSACNDGNACTTSDTCNSSGVCAGSAITCNSPPGQCYQSSGTCSGGSCYYAPSPAGTSCSDGNSCTSGDACNGSGGCNPGTGSCCGVGYSECFGMCCRNTTQICDYDLGACVRRDSCPYPIQSKGSGEGENIEYCSDTPM